MFWLKRAIQAVPSACSRWPPVGSGALRSKTPMLSRPRKPPSNTFLPKRSLRLTHQVKFSRSLLKVDRRKSRSGFAAQGLLGAIEEQRRKGVDGRVHVAEVPLVGGHLAVGVEVRAAKHQVHLVLGKVGVHDRQRQRVKGQIPGRVPGVLPLVGHRDDVLVQHVEPLRVPRVAIPVMERVGVVLVEPVVPVEEEELLAPEHAREGLTHHVGRVFADGWRRDRRVEVVGLTKPGGEDVVERLSEGLPFWLRRSAARAARESPRSDRRRR